MRPRRIALLAAMLAGLVAAVVVLQSLTEAPPVHDMHERYRVELDLPPVEAALWFAARYPKYFTSGEAQLGPWLDQLAPRDRDFVLALAQTLTWAWVEHELAGFGERDPSSLARAATIAIRHETLNQLELNTDHYLDADAIEFNAELGDPMFAAGVFARLVRGIDNCEGQNHLLAVLLDATPELDAVMVGLERDGHQLVRLRGPTLGQPIYVDAWSNLPPFTLDQLGELGESPPSVVPGLPGRAPFPAAVYAAGTPISIAPLSDRDAPTKSVDLELRAPALDEAGLARVKDPWQLYLFARILDVYDDPRADDLYRRVLEQHCDTRPRVRTTIVCAASTMLLERL